MNVVMVSNFMNNHQRPLAESFLNALGLDSFRFVATCPTDKTLQRLSHYDDLNSLPYVIKSYETKETRLEAERVVSNADVAIIAPYSNPDFARLRREESRGFTFFYLERLLKRSSILKYFPPKRYRVWDGITRYRDDARFHALCASAFASADLACFGFPLDRCWKWGYFPKVLIVPELRSVRDSTSTDLMWCGRFIGWKRPIWPIMLAKRLRDEGLAFRLKMVGDGPLFQKASSLVRRYDLDGFVTFTGPISSADVYKCMSDSDIFLSTSTRMEGWGAVVNEAMQCGCAVVAGHSIGSAPYLINNHVSGCIYDSHSFDSFCNEVKYLMCNPEMRVSIGQASALIARGLWSADTAAQRFIELCAALNSGGKSPWVSGPASPAEFLTDNWLDNRRSYLN